MKTEDGRETWSNLTINEIEAHLKTLKMRIPYLHEKMSIQFARGSTRGADVTVSLIDECGTKHALLFEVEQYARAVVIRRRSYDGPKDIIPQRTP
jgi:hypothetical protein